MKTKDGLNFNELKTVYFIDTIDGKLIEFARAELTVRRGLVTRRNGEDFNFLNRILRTSDFYGSPAHAQAAYKDDLLRQIAHHEEVSLWTIEQLKTAKAKLEKLEQDTSVLTYPNTKPLETIGGVRV